MSGPNRKSNGNPSSCVSALLFYLAAVFIFIVAIKHLTGS